jgi:hypothetical protein
MKIMDKRRITAILAITVVVVGALVVAVAKAADHGAKHGATIAASHMFTGTPALNKLRAQANLPTDVQASVQRLATFDHSDPTTALASVRLARAGSNLASTVYTFIDQRGNPCVVVVGETGFCNPDGGTSTAGINWSLGGGDAQNPDRLIAVYSTDVSAVSLAVDGAVVPVAMNNNIAYAEFPADSTHATLTVGYLDGSSQTINTDLTGRISK